MKSKIFLYIANAVVTLNVGVWVGLNIDFSVGVTIFNYICLVLTTAIPSVYITFATRKSLDKSINEALIPSALITGAYFIINILASSLLLALNRTSIKTSVVIEIVLLSLYVILLSITLALTGYIRKTYKGGNK